MSLFLAKYVNKVDKKGRVSVPSQFRLALGPQVANGILAFRSRSIPRGLPVIDAAGYDRIEEYSRIRKQYVTLFNTPGAQIRPEDEDRVAEINAILGDASPLSLDGEGRVVLPPNFAKHAEIAEQAAFVGQGEHFYICSPETAGLLVERELTRRVARAGVAG